MTDGLEMQRHTPGARFHSWIGSVTDSSTEIYLTICTKKTQFEFVQLTTLNIALIWVFPLGKVVQW